MRRFTAAELDQLEFSDEALLWQVLKPPIRLAALAVCGFAVGFTVWSLLAPLATAAVAPGRVSTEGSRRVIQHLEGGIVADVLVEEGDHVVEGQLLAQLDDTQARAAFQAIEARHRALTALEARLEAELALRREIEFPDWLLEAAHEEGVGRLLQDQRNHVTYRIDALESGQAVLRQRIVQAQEEQAGTRDQLASQQRAVKSLDLDLAAAQRLAQEGILSSASLRETERARERLVSAVSASRAALARTHQSIATMELEIRELEVEFLEDAGRDLASARADQLLVEERRRAAEDVLSRTQVRSPVKGAVTLLRVRTRGGVVAPGAPILDVVPEDEELIVESRVRPADIDVVEPGLEATVRVTAFDQRHLKPIRGIVRTVSADSLSDEATGEPYYLARVEIPPEQLEQASDGEPLRLMPGMPAEVLIVTGEETLWSYLMGPVRASLRRVFTGA